MLDRPIFEDNLEEYKKLLPKEVLVQMPIYKELVLLVSEIQKRLPSNFYRVSDITKLEEAVANGKIKPARYSVIEEKNGQYQLVRYSDLFEKEFAKIVLLLGKIEKTLKPGVYKDYITSLISAYTNNGFIDPYKKWLQMPNNAYPIDFVLFPDETEFDTKFNTMLSFDASVRVLSPEFLESQESEYKKYLLGVALNLPQFSELHQQFLLDIEKLRVRVDYSIYSAGVHFLVPYYSQNLPDERDFSFNWGTKVVVYKTSIDNRVNNSVYPQAVKLFENFDIDKETYAKTLTHRVYIHETVEALMKFEGSAERLGNSFSKTREFNSELFGMNSYILYLLKTSTELDEIKALPYTYINGALHYYKRNHLEGNRSSHYYQYVAALNYFFEKQSVKIHPKSLKLEVDAKKVISNISELAKVSSNLFMTGTKKEADAFFDKYSDTKKIDKILGIK